MKWHHYLVCFCCLFTFQTLNAQEEPEQINIIYLNDSTFVKGFIEERQDNGDMKVRLLLGSDITLKASEVQSIESDASGRLYFRDGRFITETGWYYTLLIGSTWSDIQSGEFDDDDSGNFSGMHLHFTTGKQLSQYLSVGGGIGMDVINGRNYNTFTFIPLYLDARGVLTRRPIAPYYSLGVGYGIASDLFKNFTTNGDKYNGGLYVKPALGLRFASRRKGKFLLELGYYIQDAYAEYTAFQDNQTPLIVKEETLYLRLELSFGWQF